MYIFTNTFTPKISYLYIICINKPITFNINWIVKIFLNNFLKQIKGRKKLFLTIKCL